MFVASDIAASAEEGVARGLALAFWRSLVIASFGLLSCGLAHAADLNLACTGDHFSHHQPYPAVETVTLKRSGSDAPSVGLPDVTDPINAPVVSDNSVQLKFKAGKLIGEYFKLTGKLFIIHEDGRLTRLLCKPAAT